MKLESLIYDYTHETGMAYEAAKLALADRAASTMPELILAAEDFRFEVFSTGGAKQKTIDRLQAVIDAADEGKS